VVINKKKKSSQKPSQKAYSFYTFLLLFEYIRNQRMKKCYKNEISKYILHL